MTAVVGIPIGVPLDPDQKVLDHCGFAGCTVTSEDQTLDLVVYRAHVVAVCAYHRDIAVRMRHGRSLLP